MMETTPGVIASTMEYLYTRVRQNEQVRKMLIEHIEASWRSADMSQRSTTPPWLPTNNNAYETIWSDVAEMYDMVPATLEA
jgi:CRISPR-associated protein Cmr2